MRIRAVFDTNVILSAILFGGRPRQCLAIAESGRAHGITSQRIIAELEAKLIVKFRVSAQDASDDVMGLVKYLEVVESTGRISGVCVDTKDEMIIECAVVGRADYIVSGDRKHLVRLGSYEGVQIVDPSTFLALVEGANST